MRDTIDMAREANLAKYGDGLRECVAAFINALERFEALVRADERADCERVVGIALLGAEMDLAKRVLRAIRARGETK
jgi:hypothetical protein